MSEDYEVGFGKPPKETQFKKGQSGNPKGRPKNRMNLGTALEAVFSMKVTITENGKTRKVPYAEAFVRQLAVKGLHGSTRDQLSILKAVAEHAPHLFETPDLPPEIRVTWVLPDGKTEEDYPPDEVTPFPDSD